MSVLTRRHPAARATRSPARPATIPAPRAVATPGVDSVREAIRGTTRRTVVHSGAWSVPVVAVAISAPAFAASNVLCNSCTAGAPVNCTINVVVGSGNPNGPSCNCGTGLVCASAGVGPLNLVNVCVAAVPSLTATTCGTGQCFGVCVAAGGAVITAVNALVGLVQGVRVLTCNVGTTGALPTNVCAIPALPPNDPSFGRFGTLCIVDRSTGLLGAALALVRPVNNVIGGLAFANRCASPYSCKTGVTATTSGICLPAVVGTVDLTIGFCQC